MAGADIKCLYVKTSKSDVTKDMIKNGRNILKRNQLSFLITSDEVKETILDFILYVDVLTMLT
jgi:hypothetical protein